MRDSNPEKKEAARPSSAARASGAVSSGTPGPLARNSHKPHVHWCRGLAKTLLRQRFTAGQMRPQMSTECCRGTALNSGLQSPGIVHAVALGASRSPLSATRMRQHLSHRVDARTSRHQEAACYVADLAGDEARLVRGKVEHKVGDLLGAAEPAEWRLPDPTQVCVLPDGLHHRVSIRPGATAFTRMP